MQKINVLTVDDSSLMQRILKASMQDITNINLVAQAYNGAEARTLIKQHKPDIITLDVEMPGMNGLEILEKIMNARPIPIIMFSAHTAEGADITFKALELGAIDVLQKPKDGLEKTLEYLKANLIPKIQAAHSLKPMQKNAVTEKENISEQKLNSLFNPNDSHCELIAIGASTGGVNAIREVLEKLPGNLPPIVITQHMPEGYTERFAQRLNRDCAMTVHEAKDHMTLEFGHAYIAPGTHHMHIERRGGKKFTIRLDGGPIVTGHRPSVDVMFHSISKYASDNTVLSVMLTGMGRDGAEGMLALRNKEHITLGQDQKSCIVYGMPKAAFEIGAVQKQISLSNMAEAMISELKKGFSKSNKRKLVS